MRVNCSICTTVPTNNTVTPYEILLTPKRRPYTRTQQLMFVTAHLCYCADFSGWKPYGTTPKAKVCVMMDLLAHFHYSRRCMTRSSAGRDATDSNEEQQRPRARQDEAKNSRRCANTQSRARTRMPIVANLQ